VQAALPRMGRVVAEGQPWQMGIAGDHPTHSGLRGGVGSEEGWGGGGAVWCSKKWVNDQKLAYARPCVLVGEHRASGAEVLE
jgi:hypothetical protein